MVYAVESLQPESVAGRVGVVALGAVFILLSLGLVWRFLAPSFFRGFVVAIGVFFSFDLVVFHWLFGLHRITEGSEANIIEPVVLVIGVALVIAGLWWERSEET